MPQSYIIAAVILYIVIIIGVIVGFIAILTAPQKASDSMKVPFINRFYAHRGLYTKDQSVPENSMSAFDAACRAGYGIELDIQLTKDGKVVVSHDRSLLRNTGEDAFISDLTFEELSKLRLYGTNERIPFFWDVLELIDGRVPIIVEFKTGDRNLELCEKAFEMLDAYEGDFCVESFDPSIVRWVRHNRPNVIRGQLAMLPERYDKDQVPALARFMMSRCLFGMLNRPHFISYEIGPKPWPVKLSEKLGAIKVCWTSHSPEDAKTNDLVIFEHYHPPVEF